MKSLNVLNDQIQDQNQANLRSQEFEAYNQILNKPIGEDYDHRNLAGQVRQGKYGFDSNPFNDMESTIKLSFVLEEMRNNPTKLNKVLGIRRHSDIGKVKYKLRHGPLSPVVHRKENSTKLFDTITRDVKVLKTSKKDLHQLQSQPSARQDSLLGHERSTIGNASYLSGGSKAAKTLHEEALDNLWNGPFNVLFMKPIFATLYLRHVRIEPSSRRSIWLSW